MVSGRAAITRNGNDGASLAARSSHAAWGLAEVYGPRSRDHHPKSEKFLVVKGQARFRSRDILTNETCMIETSGAEPMIVETIPGWADDIINIGDDEMFVLLWANEIFDPERPDTIACATEGT